MVYTSFFADAADIGRREVQDAIAAEHGLPVAEVRAIVDGGDADAALVADLELKDTQQILGSPTCAAEARSDFGQWLWSANADPSLFGSGWPVNARCGRPRP